MGEALDLYREKVCEAEGHTHGEEGELDCLLQRLAEARAGDWTNSSLDGPESSDPNGTEGQDTESPPADPNTHTRTPGG